MAILTDQRSYGYRNPAVIAASKWMDARYASISNRELTASEKEIELYRYSPVALGDIWVENAVPTTNQDGKCVTSFAIRKRGFVCLDAICSLVTIEDIIKFYSIPVKTFATYQALFTYLKTNKVFGLYKVTAGLSGKYGLLDDTSLTTPVRYSNFINALSGVKVNTVISYSDVATTVANPVSGTIALSHGSMVPVTMELYHYQDIIKL